MKALPGVLQEKLKSRKESNALRKLPENHIRIDFSSNDYIGFASSTEIKELSKSILQDSYANGATGSRLISGNHSLYDITEQFIANFHRQESALIFNSGYNANVGFFSCIPQRGDVVFYDELIHASIRDGLAMGIAQSLKFKHNNFQDLEHKVLRWKEKNKGTIYVVTESVFSMDGDSSDLLSLVEICKKHALYLVVDEAHALGVFGKNGEGLVNQLEIENDVFAQIVTFGKALGCHGAAILGSADLKTYLVNFARSFIYTTGLSPHSLSTIYAGYQLLGQNTLGIEKLYLNIKFFKEKVEECGISEIFVDSISAIQCCVIAGNDRVKSIAKHLQEQGFEVKPILSPTVPKGKERLRICLHSFNSPEEIHRLLMLVCSLLNS